MIIVIIGKIFIMKMSNFTCIAADFPEIADSAMQAEGYISLNPRSACFYSMETSGD